MRWPRTSAVALLLVAGAAWPCSLAGRSTEVRFVSPAPRTPNVPLNAEVKVLLDGPSLGEAEPALLDGATGARVAASLSLVQDVVTVAGSARTAEGRLYRLRPGAALEPRHGYVVTWGGKEVSRFETGTHRDARPPSAPGRVSSSFTVNEPFCGYDTRQYELQFDDAEDAETPAGQLLYLATLDGEEGPRVVAVSPRHRTLGESYEVANLVMPEPARLEGTLAAVDWAGNAGPSQRLSLSPGFAGTAVARRWRQLPEEVRLVGGVLCSACSAVVGLVLVLTLRLRRPRRPAAGA